MSGHEPGGYSALAAMLLVGHKIEGIYRRYSIDDEASLREAVAKLAALHKLDAASESASVVVPMKQGDAR